MSKKNITKTTTEYTYDNKGFILKEVKTVETYEQELLNVGDFLKTKPNGLYEKATGVPFSTGISYDSQSSISAINATALPNGDIKTNATKADSFVINTNGDTAINGNLKVNTESLNELVRKVTDAIDNAQRQQSLRTQLRKPSI